MKKILLGIIIAASFIQCQHDDNNTANANAFDSNLIIDGVSFKPSANTPLHTYNTVTSAQAGSQKYMYFKMLQDNGTSVDTLTVQTNFPASQPDVSHEYFNELYNPTGEIYFAGVSYFGGTGFNREIYGGSTKIEALGNNKYRFTMNNQLAWYTLGGSQSEGLPVSGGLTGTFVEIQGE
jgi:hypothetical protein